MLRSELGKLNQAVNAYVDGDELVILSRWDGKLHRRTQPAERVCFIRASDLSREAHRELASSRIVRSVKREGDFWRIAWRDGDALKRLTSKDGLFDSKGIPTFEADVDPVRRWLTDNPITVQRPRRCYLDIESDSRVNFQQKRTARMLCWSVTDHDTEETRSGMLQVDSDDDERRIIQELWAVLDDYDQICAWSGEWFDFPFLEARTNHACVRVDPRRWLWLDHLLLFKRMNMSASESGEEKQSMALDAVAKIIVGAGKLEIEDDELAEHEKGSMGAQSWEQWAAGGESRKRLDLYCRRDSQLMLEIEKKTGYLELLYTVCEVCSTFPDTRGANPSQQVDGFLLRLTRERGLRSKTKVYAESNEKFAGAYNLDPVRGLHTDEIHVCDFAGMYPSIIITFNMSPETFRPNIILKEDTTLRSSYYAHLPPWTKPIPAGHCSAPLTEKVFELEPLGILPDALIRVRKLRKFWKDKSKSCTPGTPEWKEADRRSTAYKVVANTFYGVVGSPFSRFFERAVAESCAQTGKWLILETQKACEARGWKVIYIDTDALDVKGCTRTEFAEFVDWCNAELYPKLVAERGCTKNLIELEFEKSFARMLIVEKKTYCAMYAQKGGTEATSDSKPEIKGLEYKRGDSLRMAREMQRDAIYKLLGFKCEPENEPTWFEQHIEEYARRVFDAPLELADVVQSKKLTKPISDYVRKEKITPPMHKLLGEDISITFTDHECGVCGAVPVSMICVRAGQCEQEGCGGKLRRRRNSAKGSVIRYRGDRIVINDGRKCVLVMMETIDHIACYTSLAEHVAVAAELQARGQNVRAGVRIEYITVDADDPFGVIPASDWNGEADRYHLWEQVYRPTKRVLDAAFPRHPWSKFERARPKMTVIAGQRIITQPKKAAPKKKGNTEESGQGSLF